jgi:lipoate-protein ligase A
VSVIKVLPDLRANGAAQMALDEGLLEAADEVIARRYTWAPPALSLGRFQKWHEDVPKLPFDVVRRPSGGRAVLHGEEFEWSFAFAFPRGSLGRGTRAGADVGKPYDMVAGAFAAALGALGVQLDEARVEPYHRSTLCFATSLRHDLSARGEKLVAVAQARAAGRVLVHGSVLERRPPEDLTQVAETLLGEPWQGEGLAGAGHLLAPEMIWKRVLVTLEAALRGLVP